MRTMRTMRMRKNEEEPLTHITTSLQHEQEKSLLGDPVVDGPSNKL